MARPPATQSFFATVPRGLEAPLSDELRALGARDLVATGGGVAFSGDFGVCYRANLHSRIATRVLWRVGSGAYRNEHEVHALAAAIDWPQYFDVGQSIRVEVSAMRSPLKSLEFATLRMKDAVCDRFRARVGTRPDVDTRHPGVRIHAFLDERTAMLYLDTSGDPLFKRGWRTAAGDAPIKENLAAGLIALTGWTGDEPFLDPMCGSGTFLLEAAALAMRIPPGSRRAFGFEKLKAFDAALWRRVRDEARAAETPQRAVAIFGSDLYGAELAKARAAVAAAGWDHAIRLKQANVLEVSPPAPTGVLLTNPPYGVRLGEQKDLEAFYPRLGDALKARFSGWRCYFFTADLRLAKLVGLKASRRTPLFNGPLECRLFEYRMVSGGMRHKAAGTSAAAD